ncbi:uncharacterized protein TNCT_238791 [Trichonephila clavata]|uniref:Uncharacterized protein n=1 Tax=Trichonephila clavata TaxID=2740835 RepID=A0A8X6GRX0_TRICU|nr:uncharacterized protein TNCT_238791 [Trichonephila clavata]
MAAPVSESSASEKPSINKNATNNKATVNATPMQDQEFSIFHAIIELQNIFNLFPALLPEMKKSYNSPDPADKLGYSIPELSSDHNPVKLLFPKTSKFNFPPPQLNTTWSTFTNILSNADNFNLPNACSTHEIDSQVSNLTKDILHAHACSSKPFNKPEQPFVQGELKQLFKDRNKARKIWQTSRHPQHKTDLNRIQNIIKRKVNEYRQQVWEDNLTSLNTEDNSLWGAAKAFRRKAAPISALNGPAGIALSDTQKTELIAKSLENQFKLNDIHNPHKDEIITNIVDAYFDTNSNNSDPLLCLRR